MKIEGAGKVPGCPREWKLRIRLESAINEEVTVRISGKNCLGNKFAPVYLLRQTWNTDRIKFADVEVGKESCKEFRVGIAPGIAEIIGSVTVPDSTGLRLGFEASNLKFPLTIPGGKELAYTVCFTGEKPGTYIFPVTVWMRRKEPAGGFTNYPISDTGVVKVKAK